MLWSTTSYTLETPSETWDTFKQLHKDRQRINKRLVELIAEDVREQADGELDPEVREELNAVLGGEGGGV